MSPSHREPDGFKNALTLFQGSARTVPAYRDFLEKNNIKPEKIRTIEDFQQIPPMDKENYLRAYPYRDLFPNRIIPPVVSMSSGSSGMPFYWPRGDEQEENGGRMHEVIFRDILRIGSERTLVIVCFSMGTWIAGAFTTASCRWLSKQGYTVTTATPGIEKEDALALLRDLAPEFDRCILAGYPPFIMDVVTEARHRHIPIHDLKLNLLFAGENFSEKWRTTIHGLTGIKDPLAGSVNIYGTADADICGHESPLSIFIRKEAAHNQKFARTFFNAATFLPTLVHYYPEKKFFEYVNDELIFTAQSGIPLIRYNIKDRGRLIPNAHVKKILREFGLHNEIRKHNLDRWTLPLLTLGGRSDVALTFYALNIYPENIKAGLEDRAVAKLVSGKFIARTQLTHNGTHQKFILHVELGRRHTSSSRKTKLVQTTLYKHLRTLNNEYRKLCASIGDWALPHIVLLPFGDPMFQVKKSKHRWISR